MERVSVIIPVYNAEKYLSECLDSLNRQTYHNLEILIVNDGSIDNSLLISKTFAEKDCRIKVYNNDNHGVSYSRNFAIEQCTGKYIAPVDADDIVAEDYIETLVSVIECSHADMAAVGVVKKNVFSANDFTKGKTEIFVGEQMISELWGKYEGFFGGKIYLKRIIKKHSLCMNENISVSEDLLFNVEYLKNCEKTVFYSGKKYFYRQISNSSSYDLNNIKWFSVIESYQLILKEIKESASYDVAASAYLMVLAEALYRASRIIDKPEISKRIKTELIRMAPQRQKMTALAKFKFYVSIKLPKLVMAYRRRKL